MKTFPAKFKLVSALALALGAFTGCESTDGGSTQVSGGVYYGAGFYDPWYYGGYDDDVDIIVTPPDRPSHVERPVTLPATVPTPRPAPMPSIPRAPMPRVRAR